MTEMGVRPWAITTNNEVALLFTLLFTMALVYHIVHLIFFQERGTIITLPFPKLSSAYSYYGITGPKTSSATALPAHRAPPPLRLIHQSSLVDVAKVHWWISSIQSIKHYYTGSLEVSSFAVGVAVGVDKK